MITPLQNWQVSALSDGDPDSSTELVSDLKEVILKQSEIIEVLNDVLRIMANRGIL